MFPIDFFWRAATSHKDRVAAIHDGRQYSFGALAAAVRDVAAGFQAMDPAPGSRVCIGAKNAYEHLLALLACLAAGKTWVPLNPRAGTPDLRRLVEFTEPTIMVLDDDMHGRIGGAAAPVVPINGLEARSIQHFARVHADDGLASNPLPLCHPQAIKFTGGTTGLPKGVMQPYRAWNTNIVSQWHAFGFGPHDRFVVAGPLTHGSSTYVLPILGAGGCLVFPDEPTAPKILEAARRHGGTTLFAPPTMIQSLTDEQLRDGRPSPSLQRIIYGGSAMLPDQIVRAQQAFGPVLAATYGQTEAPQIIAYATPSELALPENLTSVGKPSLLTLVAIESADRRHADPGETGEIVVRGDLVMEGYWRMPEKTAETLSAGWLRTGDVGQFDARGYLFIKGRSREVIITGGFNVYPSDVEAAIAEDPAILECCVVGIPDPKWGEAIHAAVTLRPGQEFDAAALQEATKAKIGSVMTPKHVHVFPALPKTAVDKISRPEVAKLIELDRDRTSHSAFRSAAI